MPGPSRAVCVWLSPPAGRWGSAAFCLRLRTCVWPAFHLSPVPSEATTPLPPPIPIWFLTMTDLARALEAGGRKHIRQHPGLCTHPGTQGPTLLSDEETKAQVTACRALPKPSFPRPQGHMWGQEQVQARQVGEYRGVGCWWQKVLGRQGARTEVWLGRIPGRWPHQPSPPSLTSWLL